MGWGRLVPTSQRQKKKLTGTSRPRPGFLRFLESAEVTSSAFFSLASWFNFLLQRLEPRNAGDEFLDLVSTENVVGQIGVDCRVEMFMATPSALAKA